MKEDLISFETATLAKKKGFNHMKANAFGNNMAYHTDDGRLVSCHRANIIIGYVLAPTQSLLQKWLREEHSIYVEIYSQKYIVRTLQFLPHSIKYIVNGQYSKDSYGKWEEALEDGLTEALNKLEDEA